MGPSPPIAPWRIRTSAGGTDAAIASLQVPVRTSGKVA
jgi:hypothetical protein